MPEPRCLSLSQFAKETGGTTTADVDAHIHAGLRSAPTTKTYARWNAAALAELQEARDQTTQAYRAAIAAGSIRAPTSDELIQARAAGHPDNESVRAAQRLLAKRAARLAEKPGLATPCPLAP